MNKALQTLHDLEQAKQKRQTSYLSMSSVNTEKFGRKRPQHCGRLLALLIFKANKNVYRSRKSKLDLLTKDIEGFKTYEDYKDDWIYEWNKDVPWVDENHGLTRNNGPKPTPVKHTCKPFNYKTGVRMATCNMEE
ncbi:hypothetical protein Tco_0123272 [Tanacetum coccineum]